jgi:hypothetical protein
MATHKKKQEAENSLPSQPESRSILKSDSPLVFVSHDTRDADLAEAFGNLLTDASGGVLQSFRSSDRKGTAGIEFGAEWYAAIMSKLSNATDVVALLTAHSIERPWILYEAGVAKGKLDTTVLGLAINIPLEKTNSGPFAQFQNCADDEDSLTKLVLQLIRRNPQAQPREEAVRRQVQAFQVTIKAVAEKRAKTPQTAVKMDENAVAKMFEEVKILVRDLPERVGTQVQEASPSRRRMNRKRFHPMMIDELLHFGLRNNRPEDMSIGLTILFSMFRDDMPWLYELGMDFTRAVRSGHASTIEATHRALRQSIEIVREGGMGSEMGLMGQSDDEVMFLMHRLTDSFERFLPRPRSFPPTRRPSKDKPDDNSEPKV